MSHIPETFIKTVIIEMQVPFEFNNFPHKSARDKENDKPFVGRGLDRKKFVNMLEYKGVFLVTGYRGMGKTSFVNIVLDDYRTDAKKKDQPELRELKITVAQKQPTETEILKLMVATLRDDCHETYKTEESEKRQQTLDLIFKSTLAVAVFIFLAFAIKSIDVLGVFTAKNGISYGIFNLNNLEIFIKWILFLLFLTSLVMFVELTRFKRKDYSAAFLHLENLYKRCYATTSYENDGKGELTFESVSTKIAYVGGRKTEVYPIASSKEIEFELISIIKKIKDEKGLKFVFVFDELDKIDQHQTGPIELNIQQAQLNELRERKEAIQEIITGLKSFLTTAEASFIFIAGREMFEASLADIADRQSAISSVFTYVFYIESLLKENIKDTSSLSSAIEDYLFRLIHKKDPEDESLYTILDKLKYQEKYPELTGKKLDLHHEEYLKDASKVNLLLQHFVVYLTYRSNGSPKKLIRLIHEFIHVGIEESDLLNMIVWRNVSSNSGKLGHCLYFNHKQQQRIGFISYLYQPFLVKYGNSFKQLSDNLVVSTSFLFDHLLKFHPFAFSHTHIELIPEILAANRTPVLRDHIKKIIDYLTLNHIRETEIGLFDYKFYSKTVNEIFYLSKSFEEESAALNFTLDESYLTKLHVKGKLKELRSRNQFITDSADGKSSAFSIAYMNGTLGDLHFFDQEYDDAIVAYSDALQAINVNLDMNMHEFILALKFKLKLGLTLEKIKSYEECLSLYSDSIVQARIFIVARIEKSEKEHYITSALNDILQVCNQAFLATLVLEEKMGVEGITAKKSSLTMGGFLTLAEQVATKCGLNSTIVSNFFLQAGNLLYFKNSVKGFEWNLGKTDDDITVDERYELFGLGWPKDYFTDIDILKHKISSIYIPNSKGYRYPAVALNMYFMGIKYLLKSRIAGFEMDFKIDKPVKMILEALLPTNFKKDFTSLSKIHFKYLAAYLSNIGDCLLSMLTASNIPGDKNHHTVENMFDHTSLVALDKKLINTDFSADPNWLDSLVKTLTLKQDISVQGIVCCYYLSSYYYGKCSRDRSRSFQLRKILYTIRLICAEIQDHQNAMLLLNILERTIVSEILEISSFNSEYADVHDFIKFKKYFAEANSGQYSKFKILNNISNSPDAREAIILFSHIKLRLLGGPLDQLDRIFASDYTLSTQYLRLLELTYAAKYYEKRIEAYGDLADAIGYLHSLTSVIEVMEIYDNDYLVGNSFLAYHHLRLAEFFEYKDKQNKFGLAEELCERASKEMRAIVKNKSSERMFNSYYNFKMAAMYYDKTIKLHTAGEDYKKAINDILYLEDDLSDSAYHFGAAMDRHLLISGKLHEHINKIKAMKQPRWKSYSAYSGNE